MRNLIDPLPLHFPIDAPPLLVFEAQDESANDDIMSSIARIMMENEKLMNANTILTKTKSSSGEMEKVLKDFLPALDSFDRVIHAAKIAQPEDETTANWIRNMEIVHHKLVVSLQAAGLEPIQSVGRTVDLNCQEVVEYRVTDEYPHNTVISEVQRGYLALGQVLREARVIVACNNNQQH